MLEPSLCAGSEGTLWSLAPKPLQLLLSKLPCELPDLPLELLGFLALKYMLFVCPLKFSLSLLETQCLYNFSQLFSRNSSPERLPCFVRAISPPVLHARHALHVVLVVGCLGGQQEPSTESTSFTQNTSFTQKVLAQSGCAAVCHIITSTLSFSEPGFFLALGSSTAAFFIPFPLSKHWVWSLFIIQYLLKWFFICPVKHVCSGGTYTE